MKFEIVWTKRRHCHNDFIRKEATRGATAKVRWVRHGWQQKDLNETASQGIIDYWYVVAQTNREVCLFQGLWLLQDMAHQ
jgi:hypothetical protein